MSEAARVSLVVADRLTEFYSLAMVLAGLTAEQITNVKRYVALQQIEDIAAAGVDVQPYEQWFNQI